MPSDARHIELIARGLCVVRGSVLICRNLEGGYGYLPGGHVEFGETASDALVREMAEETGASVRIGACLLVAESTFRQRGSVRHELNLVFHMELALSPPTHAGTALAVAPASREASIGFDWVLPSQFGEADIRPAWLRPWLAQRSTTMAMQPTNNTRCEWLSRFEA